MSSHDRDCAPAANSSDSSDSAERAGQTELAELTNAGTHRRKPSKSPRIKAIVIGEGVGLQIEVERGVSLARSFGATEDAFAHSLCGQIFQATAKGRTPDQEAMDFTTLMITGMQPRDEVEGMLLAQMATVHLAAVAFARRLNHVENLAQQDGAERAFNKLTRTFAAQLEALKRYRSNGEQKMTVEHVTVNAGGQAIVGNVTRPPGAGEKPVTTP